MEDALVRMMVLAPKKSFSASQSSRMKLVVNSGRVMTRGELYERLYGWSGEAESNTLDVYISQIRRKLGSGLIKTVRGVGYIVPRE